MISHWIIFSPHISLNFCVHPADLGRCDRRASGISRSIEIVLMQVQPNVKLFGAVFCIVIYYPSLAVSVGFLCPMAQLPTPLHKSDSIVWGNRGLLTVPENCWCCCNSLDVDKKNHTLPNSAPFVQLALVDVKQSKDHFLDYDNDWSSRERDRGRETVRMASSTFRPYGLSLADSDSWIIKSLFTEDIFFFLWEHGIWAWDEITKDKDTSGNIPRPYSQNISHTSDIHPHIVELYSRKEELLLELCIQIYSYLNGNGSMLQYYRIILWPSVI